MGKEIISSEYEPQKAGNPFRTPCVLMAIFGLLLAVVGFVNSDGSKAYYYMEYGRDMGELMYMMPTILGSLGVLFLLGALALGFGGGSIIKSQGANQHLTVYENGVAGTAAKIQQGVTQVTSFQLPYDKIESVAANQLTLTIHSATYIIRCTATNAEALQAAIASRIQSA